MISYTHEEIEDATTDAQFVLAHFGFPVPTDVVREAIVTAFGATNRASKEGNE